jgi:hypothetical protein
VWRQAGGRIEPANRQGGPFQTSKVSWFEPLDSR